MRTWLIRLYPAPWRARYGDEFESVLHERSLGPFDVLDVVLGAVDAHLHLRGMGVLSEHRKGFPMSLRLGGVAATIGGVMWLAALTWTVLDGEIPGAAGLPLFLVAIVALLIGLAGLSAFQAREHPVLIWAAFGLPAAGAVIATIGLAALVSVGDEPIVAGIFGWGLFILGLAATILGSGLFALATYRTGALPRSGAAVLGISSVISVLGFIGTSGIGGWIGSLFALGIAAFAVGWIVLGWQAISLDRRVTAPGGV